MKSQTGLNLYDAYQQCFPDGGRPLLTTADETVYTYADAEHRSAQVANYLFSLGLVPGDRVSVQVEKSPEVLWLFLGVVRAGMVFHPLNTAYTDAEMDYFLSDAGTALLVCDPARAAGLARLCQVLGSVQLRTLAADGSGSLSEGWQALPGTFETVETRGESVASLVYSSGTTGKPKGIMLSHANLVANATTLATLWGFTERDCLLHALPVFHVHGLFVALGCVLMSGASLRWLPRFDAEQVIAQLPATTVMMGVPTYYTRLLGAPTFTREVCAGMRLFISGSAPLHEDTFRAFRLRTGLDILERYGMTETGMNTSNPLDGHRKPGTVGLPLPDVEVRICDVDDSEVPTGEVGELQVRGPNVFVGYWNMPEKTAEDFTADGFFRTGDQASRDEEGYITIVGRSRDMVITGGLNVYPREVEQQIDAIEGVRESAVIGLPDPDFGEVVVAVVVALPDAELSQEQVRQVLASSLARFKIPKRVFFVSDLPRNTMGKVQKALLRQTYAKA
jgi:malonyl-CoA/methylmalonyl-CoA synthetase